MLFVQGFLRFEKLYQLVIPGVPFVELKFVFFNYSRRMLLEYILRRS